MKKKRGMAEGGEVGSSLWFGKGEEESRKWMGYGFLLPTTKVGEESKVERLGEGGSERREAKRARGGAERSGEVAGPGPNGCHGDNWTLRKEGQRTTKET